MAKAPENSGATNAAKPAAKKPAASRVKTTPAVAATAPKPSVKADAKAKFSKALEEAKAGAVALTAGAREKATARSGDWVDEAKVYGQQAKVKAGELAVEGKARATDAISGLGKLVSDNAGSIDDRFGTQYGDYARTASRKIQETAEKLEAKELDELGEDAREFVRKSPGLAVGLAAVAGFFIARLFTGSNSK